MTATQVPGKMACRADSRARRAAAAGDDQPMQPPEATTYPATDEKALGFTAKDAAFLRQSGFKVVRLGINWSQLLPDRPADPGRFLVETPYLERVVRVARLLAAEKIFVLLDLHQDCWQEWPQWAVPYDKGNTSPLPFPLC